VIALRQQVARRAEPRELVLLALVSLLVVVIVIVLAHGAF